MIEKLTDICNLLGVEVNKRPPLVLLDLIKDKVSVLVKDQADILIQVETLSSVVPAIETPSAE